MKSNPVHPYPAMMTGWDTDQVAWTRIPGERSSRQYLRTLFLVLAGYALFGRGFAYLGIFPLYVGEVMMLWGGVLTVFHFGKSGRLPGSILLALSLFWIWNAGILFHHFGGNGMDAVRDGMMWVYSIFLLIAFVLFTAFPTLYRGSFQALRKLYVILPTALLVFYVISRISGPFGPTIPGAPVALIGPKGGDMLVHLSGCAAFMAVGFSKRTLVRVAALCLCIIVVIVGNRGGMLALFAAMSTLFLLSPPRLNFSPVIVAVGILFTMALLFQPSIQIDQDRELSVEQFVENLESVISSSDSKHLDSTKSWRMDWWTKIIQYTFGGPYGAFGKGYGVNLATDDGFQVLEDESLRSPHNIHFNFLARSGIPGFLIWLSLMGLLFVRLLRGYRQARMMQSSHWQAVFAWLVAFLLAFLVNASFDVFLEGPLGAIWFWSLVGMGLASIWHFEHNPHILL